MAKGCIDILTHQGISGWVAPQEDEGTESRFIRVWLDGTEIATVRADQLRPDLRQAGISNGYSGFRFVFPTAPNPLADHLIEVRDRDTGDPVTPCPMPLKSLLNGGSESMLQLDPLLATTHVRTAFFADGLWTVEAELLGPEVLAFRPSVQNGTIEHVEEISAPDHLLSNLGICRRIARCKVRGELKSNVMFLDLVQDPTRIGVYEPVCHIALPTRIPYYLDAINEENMTRVSGPGVTRDLFAASGINTAYRLDSLLRRHFGKGLAAYSRIFDWGVGSGRVALPIKNWIAPAASMTGSDVDDLNVQFGKAYYPEIEFVQSPFYPPLPFKDQSFDMAYGISVVTHLTEGAQFAWLKELRRVVKTGAPVILTVHGEYGIIDVAIRDPRILEGALTRGISDQMMDMNLGPKLRDKSYYRATFHTRKYVSQEWTEHFDILAHYSCSNVVVQDFVVLRAK
jgi:ubiquinone/menaquinone biosynthesis C-methylase UbiE